MRVTTVSVKVLFVIVSVTRPGPVGAGGRSMVSGFLIVTVTACVGSGAGFWWDLFRKWAGIMAWNSSFVMGFGSTWTSSPSRDEVGVAFLWFAVGSGSYVLLLAVAVGGVCDNFIEGSACWDDWGFSLRGAGCGISAFGAWSRPFVFGSFVLVSIGYKRKEKHHKYNVPQQSFDVYFKRFSILHSLY